MGSAYVDAIVDQNLRYLCRLDSISTKRSGLSRTWWSLWPRLDQLEMAGKETTRAD